MWASGGASWVQNTAVLAPACFLFAFACLSPWHICRVRPLRLADTATLAVTWTAAAAAAAGMFAGAAWAMARLEGRPAAHLALLFGMGVLLYLLSAGLHYAALAAEESREAERRAAEARTLAREAELQALAHADQSALSVQQPALHRRPGHAGRRTRARNVHPPGGFPAQQPGPGRAREHPAARGTGAGPQLPRSGAGALRRAPARGARTSRNRARIARSPRCCCNRWWKTPSSTASPAWWRAAPSGWPVERIGADVRITVENGFDPDARRRNRLGMGLAHVRRRLELRYGEDASFDAGGRDGVYRVVLRFPCESPMASSSRA